MIRVQRPFYFRGRIPLSKSWLNRALILKSIHNQIRILDWDPSELDGEDVLALDHALKDLAAGKTDFFIAESGTGLRFLLARLSILNGQFSVRGTEKLLSRPLDELVRILDLLGCKIEKKSSTELSVSASGWPDKALSLKVASGETSQFLSALLLAASHRSPGQGVEPIEILEPEDPVSAGYIEMTKDLVDQVAVKGRRVLVPEVDASSAATLGALVIAGNRAENIDFVRTELGFFKDQVEKTKQPDRVFFEFVRDFLTSDSRREFNLKSAPDLFPIMSALGALQPNGVRLAGAPHLRLKESDRISEIVKLLRLIGISVEEYPDGIETKSVSAELRSEWRRRTELAFPYIYQPPADHRLAFAATVLSAAGVPIELVGRGMVAKSFPTFWSIVEGDGPKVALLGHRGTGKTEASRRWAHLLGARATAVDLDREIERLCGRSVRELFEKDGEGEFRFYEKKAFGEMDEESRRRVGAFLVACGAGFDASRIDQSWQKIWLRRATDEDGRVFFGRPRLDPDISPIEESKKRYFERTAKYALASNRIFDLAEGDGDPSEQFWVRDLFDEDSLSGLGGTISLIPEMHLGSAMERYLRWGVARMEVRDDFFPHDQFGLVWARINEMVKDLPTNRIIVSFRNPLETDRTITFLEGVIQQEGFGGITVDWPFEITKELPARLKSIIRHPKVGFIASWHGDFGNLELDKFIELERSLFKDFSLEQSRPKVAMKLAATINSFDELQILHAWVRQSTGSRVLLPMSKSGSRARWSWYRLLRGSRVPMGLSFWRDGNGTSVDQPTFSQWWRRQRFADVNRFAAVLGDPVHHSRTPLEHDSFFTSLGMPVFAIQISREEAETALPFLADLGLVAAAVTSPLKELVCKHLNVSMTVCASGTAANNVSGNAVNTLVRSESGWLATATDEPGFRALWTEAKQSFSQINFSSSTVLWGGGGIKQSVLNVVPHAIPIRASLGPAVSEVAIQPEIVIWASGKDRGEWHSSWKPKLVLDLSYTDDSAARTLAVEIGAKYISGLSMFRAQAQGQREFWSSRLSQ